MTDNNQLKWDVSPRKAAEDLKHKLVNALLDRMTPEQLRSRVFHDLCIQYTYSTKEELLAEAAKHDILLEE